MGIRTVQGASLQRMIAVLGSVAFLIQGYNQALMNGFSTLPTFLETIPQVDTVHTKGHQKSHNSTILGQFRYIEQLRFLSQRANNQIQVWS